MVYHRSYHRRHDSRSSHQHEIQKSCPAPIFPAWLHKVYGSISNAFIPDSLYIQLHGGPNCLLQKFNMASSLSNTIAGSDPPMAPQKLDNTLGAVLVGTYASLVYVLCVCVIYTTHRVLLCFSYTACTV